VRSDYAYGRIGAPPAIENDEDLEFEVELKSIGECEKTDVNDLLNDA
jgi:hypothetical protein